MRYTFVILIIAAFFNSSYSQKNNINPNGYNKFYYQNGKISSEGNMENGKPTGLWKSYYLSGKLKTEGYRKKNKLDSIWKFYNEDGYLIKVLNYRNNEKNGYFFTYKLTIDSNNIKTNYLISKELYLNDKKNGVSYYYTENQVLKRSTTYQDGYKHGTEYYYNDKGQIISILKYINDNLYDNEIINRTDKEGKKQGLWKEFFLNGNVQIEANYKNGLLHGYYKEYNTRGRILETKHYVDGKLIDLTNLTENDNNEELPVLKHNYYKDGNIKFSGSYIDTIPVGTHNTFDSKGNIIKTEIYSPEGTKVSLGIIDKTNKKQGKWKYLYPNGNIRAEGVYKNGRRIGEWKFYHSNKNFEQIGSYKKGWAEGAWYWYYPNKNIRRTGNFLKGKENGLFIEYSQFGDTLSKGAYIRGEKEGEWIYNVNDHFQIGKYKNNQKNGLWKHYFPDNKLQFEGNYVFDKEDGKHITYYPDGKQKLVSVYELGIKAENWKYYDEQGFLQTTITYRGNKVYKIDGKKIKE